LLIGQIMKAIKFLAIDYPDLDPATAVWTESRRLRQEAYHWQGGRIVGIRNIKLLTRSLDLAVSVPKLIKDG
jgi:hypothetical protein